MKSIETTARKDFALQLVKYRNAAGLTQTELATGLESQQSYIANLESGKANLSLDKLHYISSYFGVKYYRMADPAAELPTEEELFNSIVAYHLLNDIDTGYLYNKSRRYTKNMDKYIQEHLTEPKTSSEIAADFKKIYNTEIKASKVSDILNRSPRKELLKITKPAGKNFYQLKPNDGQHKKPE